jgi:phenylacetic acid degradation protein PaaD
VKREPGFHDKAGGWVQAVLAGDRGAVARAISQVERGDRQPAAVAAALAPHLGRAHVLGVTGSPGAGKSTLVHALLGELLARRQRIAVVAVDPSSPITGGAVLGDRVRMGEHGAHASVFIRSVASRGHLGGLAPTTEAMVDILDAAGFDTVIVETVGAGQSEVEIMRVADTRLVACTLSPRPGAEITARDLKDMLHLRAAGAAGGWKVPVIGSSAATGSGIAELADAIAAHAAVTGRGRRLHGRQAVAAAGNSAAGERVKQLAAADPFLRWAGIVCTHADKGTATVEVTLQPHHINFNGTCHGGIVFALADTAFGLAANSYGVIAAGIDTHLTFQQASHVGDHLVAKSVEVSRSRKIAVYRVDVCKNGGVPISSFTGTVYLTTKPHTV